MAAGHVTFGQFFGCMMRRKHSASSQTQHQKCIMKTLIYVLFVILPAVLLSSCASTQSKVEEDAFMINGARPGVFNFNTGNWTDTGPPNTDTSRSVGEVLEDGT